MKRLKWIFSIALISLMVSCQQPAAEQAPPAEHPVTPAPDHSQQVNEFLAAMDAADSVALFANCADNFVVYHPNYPAPLDRAGWINHLRTMNGAFSGAKHTATEIVSASNGVASRGIVSGKHTGEFNGIPASNNDVTVDWLSFSSIDENGKWTALYIQFNQMSFMSQVGVKLPGS